MEKRAHTPILAGLLAAAITMLPQTALAFSLSCPWGKCPAKKKEVFDQSKQMLIWEVAHNPSLMNVEYLGYFIGHPENEKQQRGSEKYYYWYGAHRQPTYQLIQRETAPGQIAESEMLFNLDGTGLTFDQLDKFFGNESRRFYDYYGQPNELFSFAPNTSLSFGCPGNSYKLSQCRIIYRGEPLPPPSDEMLQTARTNLSQRALLAADAEKESFAKRKPGKKQKPSSNPNAVPDNQLLPMLVEHVKAQPLDPAAHLALAQAFQRKTMINEALSEYKIALAMSGENEPVRQQAIKALQDMMILPADGPPVRRNIEIVDNGQHMRVVGEEKKSKKLPDPDKDN